MIKPESNAPSQMQPWVRTTDKQIEDLERTIARLESVISGGNPQPDFAQNFAVNNAFSFVRQADNSLTTNTPGMKFTGDVIADTSIDVAGSLTVGNPDRQVVNDAGEVIDTIPNFEVIAGQYSINPVTSEGSYGAGELHMNDSNIRLDVNGVISGDGLSIDLSNTGQSKRENVAINNVSGDGSLVTFKIPNTATTLAVYIPGETVTVTGVDPTDYNFVNTFITTVDSSDPTWLYFTVESSVTAAYVAGGYVTISSYNSTYEGKFSVQGVGPDYYGITVNQDGVYAGIGGGNPLTATAYVTPTTLKAPELSGDYLKVNNTKVSVSVTAPTSPANGDLWIDPTGSSAVSSMTGSLVAQSLRSSYASATARDAAIPLPIEGMLCYLEDVNQVTSYIGSAWYPIAGQMPRMHLKLNTAFSITNGSTSTVTGWTTVSNNSTFSGTSGVVTVPLTGRYNITFVCIHTANNTTGGRGALIALSSTGLTYRNTLPAPQSSGHSQSVFLNMNSLNLTANDTVTLQAYQNSGATNTLTTDTFFIIEYVGP